MFANERKMQFALKSRILKTAVVASGYILTNKLQDVADVTIGKDELHTKMSVLFTYFLIIKNVMETTVKFSLIS